MHTTLYYVRFKPVLFFSRNLIQYNLLSAEEKKLFIETIFLHTIQFNGEIPEKVTLGLLVSGIKGMGKKLRPLFSVDHMLSQFIYVNNSRMI